MEAAGYSPPFLSGTLLPTGIDGIGIPKTNALAPFQPSLPEDREEQDVEVQHQSYPSPLDHAPVLGVLTLGQ